MEQLDRLEQLLKEYDYRELSDEDKAWVMQQVGSEEEYESLRRTTHEITKHFTPLSLSPRPEQWKTLRKQWSEKHAPLHSGLMSRWSVPAYAAILALVGVACSGWYVGSQRDREPVFRDRLITRVDTVEIKIPQDTVTVVRVIYRNVPTPIPVSLTSKEEKQKDTQTKGINMKEKEELEKLMVSGY